MFEKINLRGQVWFTSLQGKKRRRRQKRSGILLARKQLRRSNKSMNQQEKRESELPVWSGINSLTYCEETLELGQVWACLHSPSQKTWFSQRGRSEAAILLVDSVFLLLLLLFFFSLSLCGATEAVNTWKQTHNPDSLLISVGPWVERVISY